MISIVVFAVFSLLSVVFADAAPRSRDSPPNTVYRAYFVKDITGWVRFSSLFGYVLVRLNIDDLPRTGGPFDYDVSRDAVPPSNECSAVSSVLDPYHGDPDARRDALKPVGDLSGKHGQMRGRSYRWVYIDPYLSTNSHNPAYVGNRGLVVHTPRLGNIACANIEFVPNLKAPVPGIGGGGAGGAGGADAAEDAGKAEVIDGVTEIVGDYYAHETVDLAHLSAELPEIYAQETGRP